MILIDYPGHLIALGLLSLWALLMLFAYRSANSENVRSRRWLLSSLHYLTIVLLFIILWNPSRMEKEDATVRNRVLVFFDTSRSMSVVDCDGTNRLDRAIDIFRNNFLAQGTDLPEFIVYGFDVDTYYAGSFESLHRWGEGTRLHTVLNCIGKFDQSSSEDTFDTRGETVGAVIFTDGQAEEKEITRYQGIFSPDIKTIWVGLGETETRGDVAVTKITAPSKTAIRTAFPVQVHLSGTNLDTQQIKVELYLEDHLIEVKEMPSAWITRDTRVDFSVGANKLGSHMLTAKVSGVENEFNTGNNIRHALIDVVEPEKLNVLFYSQVVNLDIGKIRQSLERDRRIRLSFGLDAVITAMQSPNMIDFAGQIRLPETREEFYSYDIIILGPCALDHLKPAQIEGLYSFVVDRGGGLILLPGRDIFSLALCRDPKIKTLLPVEFGEASVLNTPEVPIRLTTEGLESNLLAAADMNIFPATASAFYSKLVPKPAARTLLAAGPDPLVCTHRVGRGFVALVNSYGLFEWYREDMEGGLLQKLMSGLTGYTGRVSRLDAGIELFAKRSPDHQQKIIYEALVYDRQFAPVSEATVLLTLDSQVIRMTNIDRNRYQVEVDDQSGSNIPASVEAQKNNVFLGERKRIFNLPPLRTEMDQVELDRGLLTKLADKLSGIYSDADDVNPDLLMEFEATRKIERFSRSVGVWTRWPLFITLCLLLSINWFIKRRLGLI